MVSIDAELGNHSQLVKFGDSVSLDAFGRLRVAQPFATVNSKFEYWVDSHAWNELPAGSASPSTHLPNESSVQMNVTSSAGDKLTRQTGDHQQYQAGNSQLFFASIVFGAIEPGIRKRVGYFDDENGIFLEQTDTGYSLTLRTFTGGSADDANRIDQADWSVNTFDINQPDHSRVNPSGKEIDFTKSIIFWLDMEWLGAGRVRCGFVQDGQLYVAHEFVHSGKLDKVYMSSGSLPIRYEIENVAGTTTGSMKQICSTVKSEGGSEIFGVPHVAVVDEVVVDEGALIPLITIRPRAEFFSKPNRGTVIPIEFELFVQGNFAIKFLLIHDGDLVEPTGGATWIDVADEAAVMPSITEFNTNMAGISGGHIHNAGFAAGANKGSATGGADIQTTLKLSRGINHIDNDAADTYTLAAEGLGGDATVSAVMRFAEIR